MRCASAAGRDVAGRRELTTLWALRTNNSEMREPTKAVSEQVKKVTLRLIETFVDKCDDTAMITTQFVPAMMDPVLGDYARNVPDARCAQRSVLGGWGCCGARWRARRAAPSVCTPHGASLARWAL